VRLTVASFDQPRVVTVRDQRGNVLVRRRIMDATTLRVPVTIDRRAELRISSDPGPQSVKETLGTPDTRSVSLSVSGPSFAFER
jgi:hypothetical protein